MSFEEKIDVIDLIINVLKEHEKTLDELISKIEDTLEGAGPPRAAAVPTEVRRPAVSVVLSRWAEFRERCARAGMTAYDIEDRAFRVSAVKDGVLYSFQEQMPDMEIRLRETEEKTVIEGIEVLSAEMVFSALRGRLECGLEVVTRGTEVKLPDGTVVYKVTYDIDPEVAKEWLSSQLAVDRGDILQGKIQI